MVLSGDETTLAWGCSKCRGDENEEGDELRKLRNCDKVSNVNLGWEWMPDLRRCPMSQIDDEAWMVLGWWAEWQRFKILPYGGSDIMSQPATVLEAFSFFEQIKTDVENKLAKKQQRDIEKSRKKAGRKTGR